MIPPSGVPLRAVLMLLSLLPAGPATAQDPDARDQEVAAALARIPPGTAVRVQTRAGAVLGGFLQLASDSVVLRSDGGGRTVVALADIRSAWYQHRATRTGAIAGAILGAGGGGAFMGLLALVAGANGSETVTLLAVGTLGGAAAGGLLGGVVGAAVPRWALAYPVGAEGGEAAPPVTEATDAGAGRRRLGSIEAALGYGRIGGDEPTGGGAGGRLALHAELGADPTRPTGTTTFLAIGPEISWFDLGGTGRLRRVLPSADTLELSRDYGALAAGGVLRGGFAVGMLRTYAVLGLAYNRWEIEERDVQWIGPGSPEPPVLVTSESRFEHIGYTVGAGAQAALRPFTAVGLELRRTSVGTFDMDLPGSYWSVTVSASRRW